jgi:2-polyprenyl-6-hydroxyphenyl methylase / 3-demethylubiquinone-9 3-methyltransferase
LSIRYVKQSAEDHAAQSPGSYDVVTCLEMLEHVPDPAAVLHALRTLVKPEGHVVLSTLNRNLKSWLLAIVGAEYVMQLLERGTHTYSRFIRPSELANWARAAELEVLDIAGLAYDPLRGTASLSQDVGVNYLMHLKRPGSAP